MPFTNYRTRYGPRRWALTAEILWRLEHCGLATVEVWAYPKRKWAERRGVARRHPLASL